MPNPDPGNNGETPDTNGDWVGSVRTKPPLFGENPKKIRKPRVIYGDDGIFWDPYLQKWIRRKKVVIDDGEDIKTFYFKKEYVDFPINYSGPNHFNASPELDEDDFDGEGSSEPDPSKGDDSYFEDEESFWQDPREVLLEHQQYAPVTFTAAGYPVDSPLVEGGQYGVQYSWDGHSYMVNTQAGAPITPVFAGAILSGAQLNVITGTNDYSPQSFWMVTDVHGLYYTDEHGGQRTYDSLMDSTFFNRNKGKGLPQWVPTKVHVSVDAINVSNLSDNACVEDDFQTPEQQEAAQSAGLNDWHFTPSPDGAPPTLDNSPVSEPPIGNVNPFWVPPVDLSGIIGGKQD